MMQVLENTRGILLCVEIIFLWKAELSGSGKFFLTNNVGCEVFEKWLKWLHFDLAA